MSTWFLDSELSTCFYNVQALIDMAKCTISCISIIMGVGFLDSELSTCFYKVQALIDMVKCAISCISIIMGVDLACHEYGIFTYYKNYHFRDLFIHCYVYSLIRIIHSRIVIQQFVI